MSNFITPVCKGKYLWLYAPNTKFGEVYSATLIMEDTDEWKGLVAKLTANLDEFYAQQCALFKKKNLKRCQYLPWKTHEETGERTFVVKNNRFGTKKDGTTFEVKPVIYGPDKQILKEEELTGSLGSGTTLCAGFTQNLWFNDAQGIGLSARLAWVQIINPVYFSGVDGFQAADGSGMKSYPKDASLFKTGTSTKVAVSDKFNGDLFDLAKAIDDENPQFSDK